MDKIIMQNQNKKENFSPYILKGKEALAYTKSLMGIDDTINENKSSRTDDIKLIKKATNNEVFALIKEKQEFFIKKLKKGSDKICLENFDYVGGLANKREFVYNTYTKAVNQLNLHLHEIAYSMGQTNIKINLLENDIIKFDNKNLIVEKIIDEEPIVVTLDENELKMEELLENLKSEDFLNFEINENKISGFELSNSFKDIISEEIKDCKGVDVSFNKNVIIFEGQEIYSITKDESVLSVVNAVSDIIKKKV